MRRRALLAAAWSAAATAAGCLGTPGDGPDDRPADGGPDDERADAGAGASPTDDVPASRGPERGQADPIDARQVETDDEVTYLPGEDAVRYVAAWRHDGESGEPTREPVYETAPFEEWAATRCASAAASAAADHAAEALDTDEVGGGISASPPTDGVAAVVSVATVIDREGEVVRGTDVEFEALLAATPRTVAATYVLDEREREREVPVFARHEVLRQQ